MANPAISILIPVLNEADGLPDLLRRLTQVLDDLDESWEVLFVDDGSRDTTWRQLRDQNDADERFRGISLSRNFGKEIAIAAGLRYAKGDAVILMDADLQHPPEVLTKFVEHWRDGYQIVYGQRVDRRTDGPWRRFLAKRFYQIYNVSVREPFSLSLADYSAMATGHRSG